MRADMNTEQAEYESALDRLRADMARRDIDLANWKTDMANWKSDMANWKTDMAQRENRQLLATIVIVGVANTILGLLITAQ